MVGPTRANPDFGPILVSVTIYYCNMNASATERETQKPQRTTNRRRIANPATELPPVGSHNRARPTLDASTSAGQKKQANHPRTPPAQPLCEIRADSNCRRRPRFASRIFGTKTQHNLCRFYFLSSIVNRRLIDLERYFFSSIDWIGYDHHTNKSHFCPIS